MSWLRRPRPHVHYWRMHETCQAGVWVEVLICEGCLEVALREPKAVSETNRPAREARP